MTNQNSDTVDRQKLLDHLLGDMDVETTEAMESKMFEDTELFYELLDLENELADSYLRGELDEVTRRKVEKRAAQNPGFAEKLKSAKALRARLLETKMRAAVPAEADPTESWFGRMMARIGLSSFGAPAMVTAALLIVLAGFAAFLLYDRIRLANDLARIRSEQQSNSNSDAERIRELERQLANVESREKDLGTRLEQNQGQSEILEEQLAKERSERLTLEREMNRIQNREMNREQVPQARIATLILSPFTGTRGPGGSAKTVDLPAGVERLSVTLQIPETFTGNRFTVTFKGRSVTTDARASVTKSGSRFVVVSLPVQDLKRDGDNVLRLTSDEGATATYMFLVEP
ncbi:MAG: hypothetical protein IPM63_18235 [Acidobacteriota bacterium]|nr:MAG: hypothetical protein IPM63_18235 [Acidobacteriota bacterium]